MSNRNNNKIYYLLPAVVLLLMIIYYRINRSAENLDINTIGSQNKESDKISETTYKSYKNIGNQGIDSDKSDTINENYQNNSVINEGSVIKINNRCRGCGRCAQIDPEHFSISEHKAIVLSNSNLTSNRLQIAINDCPENAILLQ